MKKRHQETVAKVFALVVILIMLFQVLLPLFNSVDLNSKTTKASVTTTPTTQVIDAKATPTQSVTTVTTTPVATPSVTPTPATPAKK